MNIDSISERAFGAAKSGDFTAAAALYREVLALAPEAHEAWHFLGIVEFKARRYAEAISALREGIRLDPGLALTHAWLGRALGESGRIQEAIESYEHALSLESNAEWYLALGRLYAQSRNPSEAERATRAALQVEPANVDALAQLGLMIGERAPSEAADLLRRAIALNPTANEARRDLAYLLMDLGRFEEAEDLVREQLDQEDSVWDHNLLGVLMYRQRRIDEAEAVYLQNRDRHPESADAWRFLGGFYSDEDRQTEAEQTLRKAVELEPDGPENTFRLAHFLECRGSLGEARGLVLKALRYNPTHERAKELARRLGVLDQPGASA